MSRSIFSLFFVIVLCVGFSSATLVRSTQTETAERVNDFAVSSTNEVTWSAFGRSWSVQLTLSDVVEDNEEYFHGTLAGDDSAIVSFALLPGNDLSGMIVTVAETYWISRQDDIIYMSSESNQDASSGQAPTFTEPLMHETVPAPEARSQVPAPSVGTVKKATAERTTVSTYKVAVYYDQNWATASNNPWSTQASTIALFNDVNAIYQASGLATFSVVYQKQVTNSASTVTDMLTYWANTMSTKLSSFTDNSYTNQLWLVGQNVGGLSYVGETCKGSAGVMKFKTAVAGLVNFSRLWTVKTIAHELGHNRGAVHTFDNQCAGSTATGCQCSVMSYCFPSSTNNPQGATNWFADSTIELMKSKGCY
eukprot:TRINITY_DN3922_c0_g3_i1.p1 TRINITY_DN3922_c0_g3~~TRINITY_DN3922_c0_g3_i1.p1  ORF type:complete len:365 (-),score=46.71 TRINITY_DN3922_c0_g3_i1:115-1209(-)